MTAAARPAKLFRWFGSGWRWLRALPSLSPPAMVETYRERVGGHEVLEEHDPHLDAAIAWLAAAQDATPDDGFSRGYSLAWHPEFRARGWQSSYPETTGYIIDRKSVV